MSVAHATFSPAHEPAQQRQPVPAALPVGRRPDESASWSASAHRTTHTGSAAPPGPLSGRTGTDREELAAFREMLDSLGAQLDPPCVERDGAARELTAPPDADPRRTMACGRMSPRTRRSYSRTHAHILS